MITRTIAAAALLTAGLATAQVAPQPAATQQVAFSTTLASALTDWDSQAGLQQFNPTLGTLQSVQLTLTADMDGTAKIESRDKAASQITISLAATLALSRPGNPDDVLLQAMPTLTREFSLTAYDGTQDFAGNSGRTLAGLWSTASAQASFQDSRTLALFTGTGTLALPAMATAEASATGSGNLALDFETLAGGSAKVTYTYLPSAVPEPDSWALMFAGLGALGWLVKRRNA